MAKRVVSRLTGVSPSRIEVLAAPDGAPEPWLDGDRLPIALSITHRGDRAACAALRAISSRITEPLGCDLERVEPRTDRFVCDFFDADEAARVFAAGSGDRDVLTALIWSAKEAALKALRTGLRRDTRSVSVALGEREAMWRRFAVIDRTDGRVFEGRWARLGDLVCTIAAPTSFDVVHHPARLLPLGP